MTLDYQKLWQLRSALKGALRKFFQGRDFLEIDTPIAVICPGTEVYLRYFPTAWTNFKGEIHPYFLRSSPELHMKQALALGVQRIFQIAPCFRNHGELARWHHPEFTMVEWYEAHLTFDNFMSQTEELLFETHASMTPVITSLGFTPITLPKKFLRLTVAEVFEQFAGISLTDLDPDLALKGIERGILSLNHDDDFETAYFKILLEKIEPKLENLGAVILYDYPPSQAALATVKGHVAKRFEVYINGIELANGFEELIEPDLNRLRIRNAHHKRRELHHEVPKEDEDFYRALTQGIPPCSGNALGFDRWLAILLGLDGIESVVPFRNAQPYGMAPDSIV